MSGLAWYLVGFFTLPAVVALLCLVDVVRSGSWMTSRDECKHDGPDRVLWRLSWRCPECTGRWVRGYVARVVPARFLRTKTP
jgi:hypothetical protein